MTKSIKSIILAGMMLVSGIIGIILVTGTESASESQPISAVKFTQQELSLIQDKIAYIKKNCAKDIRCQSDKLVFKNPGNIKNIIKELKKWLTTDDKTYSK